MCVNFKVFLLSIFYIKVVHEVVFQTLQGMQLIKKIVVIFTFKLDDGRNRPNFLPIKPAIINIYSENDRKSFRWFFGRTFRPKVLPKLFGQKFEIFDRTEPSAEPASSCRTCQFRQKCGDFGRKCIPMFPYFLYLDLFNIGLTLKKHMYFRYEMNI